MEDAEFLLPESSYTRLAAEINLARANILTNDIEAALTTLPNILLRMEETIGQNSPAAGRIRSILGKALMENGQPESAIRHLRQAYNAIEASEYWRLPGNQWVSDVTVWRAQAEFAAGDYAIALKLANAGLKMRRKEKNAQPWRVREASKTLSALAAGHE